MQGIHYTYGDVNYLLHKSLHQQYTKRDEIYMLWVWECIKQDKITWL